mgnify:CR=1 FL=1
MQADDKQQGNQTAPVLDASAAPTTGAVEGPRKLRILVGKLRAKLGDDASAPRYVQTESGVGLRFIPSEW